MSKEKFISMIDKICDLSLKSTQSPPEPTEVRFVNIPVENNRPAIIANRIQKFGIGLQDIIIGLTFYLLRETIKANLTSSNSLTEARNAVTQASNAVAQATRANDIAEDNLELAREAARENAAVSKRNLALSEKSVASQINSLKQTQRQFELDNTPNLEVKGPLFSDIG